MLGIGHITGRAAREIHAIPDAAVGMIESYRRNRNPGMRAKLVRRAEIAEFDGCMELLRCDREEGRAHESFDHLPACGRVFEMSGINSRCDRRVVKGFHEGKSDDEIEMTVAEEKVEVGYAFSEQAQAEARRAGSGVEDQDARSAAHLHTARIAAEGAVLRRRGGHAAACAPDPYQERRVRHTL